MVDEKAGGVGFDQLLHFCLNYSRTFGDSLKVLLAEAPRPSTEIQNLVQDVKFPEVVILAESLMRDQSIKNFWKNFSCPVESVGEALDKKLDELDAEIEDLDDLIQQEHEEITQSGVGALQIALEICDRTSKVMSETKAHRAERVDPLLEELHGLSLSTSEAANCGEDQASITSADASEVILRCREFQVQRSQLLSDLVEYLNKAASLEGAYDTAMAQLEDAAELCQSLERVVASDGDISFILELEDHSQAMEELKLLEMESCEELRWFREMVPLRLSELTEQTLVRRQFVPLMKQEISSSSLELALEVNPALLQNLKKFYEERNDAKTATDHLQLQCALQTWHLFDNESSSPQLGECKVKASEFFCPGLSSDAKLELKEATFESALTVKRTHVQGKRWISRSSLFKLVF